MNVLDILIWIDSNLNKRKDHKLALELHKANNTNMEVESVT